MTLEQWHTLTTVDPVDSNLAESQFAKAASAEQRLMLAVLENAIEQFKEYALAEDSKGKALFDEVEEWMSERDSEWFFSFENICETLRLSPDYIHQGLLLWKESMSRKNKDNHLSPAAARRTAKAYAALARTHGKQDRARP
jgi:hypothetical protein